MSSESISRRKLLASVPAVCLLTICNVVRAAAKQQPCKLSLLSELLMQQLADNESACVVGHAYLRIANHEANIQRLIPLIINDPEGWTPLCLEWDQKSCYAFLQRRFKSDFESGRVVEVEGWILSETEARVYALAAVDSL